jgi:hypothetical protein
LIRIHRRARALRAHVEVVLLAHAVAPGDALQRRDLGLDADFVEHLLEDLGLQLIGLTRDHDQVDGEALRRAGLREQRLGLVQIEGVRGYGFVVADDASGQVVLLRHAHAGTDRFRDGVPVDRVADRLA